ncbi:MAG: M15 family metallopeptidase [Halieaceae bacterium]|jgi:D-alanyl-D-alanine dipeptidase|nr:M15 family metallopeptidase [Halieaceae bacterium]
MIRMRFFLSALAGLLFMSWQACAEVPAGFVALREVAPEVVVELRYLGANNFVGEPVDGYLAERCFLTTEAADALARVQARLVAFSLGLKVFDAYRPQRAVDHFVRWASDLEDTRRKADYYPRVAKDRLFAEGYIAARSGHSRGSTVDLTIVSIDGERRQELDMGTPFDFFGPESHALSKSVTAQQRANRMLLRRVMVEQGFRPLAEEWWHFTLSNEPYPDTYFDFPVE